MKNIAPARTFGFLDEGRQLREQGLALGGSLNNAIVVDNDRIVNPDGLRFPDEFVRHKVLDAIGDLSLIGASVTGHYKAFKCGHLMNKLLIYKLLKDKSAWSLTDVNEQQLQDTSMSSSQNGTFSEDPRLTVTGMLNG